MKLEDLIKRCEQDILGEFQKIDELSLSNSKKVLNAFHNNNVSETDFNSTTGYGYNDVGRDKIEKIFSEILGSEDALVRNQFISGSHALNVALFSILRPGDTMLIITGEPYDTLKEVIGLIDNSSSLKSFKIDCEIVDLKEYTNKNGDIEYTFDYEKIVDKIERKDYKLIYIQRSRGYSLRNSLTIDKIENVIKQIKNIFPKQIIMVDNCYCEFVESKTPVEVGADLMVGSLIKNLGGGIAPNGAYIAGAKKYIELAGERLSLPGEGRDVGPTLGINEQFLRGIYMASSVVASSLKTALLASRVFECLGFKVKPKYNDSRADIVQMIIFEDENKMIKFVEGIQAGSAIDAHAIPNATDMPGYKDKIIMASGSFVQGSSIEISADGPIKAPYAVYLQGGLTYEYGKLALIKALEWMNIIDE